MTIFRGQRSFLVLGLRTLNQGSLYHVSFMFKGQLAVSICKRLVFKCYRLDSGIMDINYITQG